MTDAVIFDRMRRLIGRDCRWLGQACRVVEVLPREARLVLELREETPPVQIDQYGQATYRANDILELPLFDAHGDFSEELMLLLDELSDSPLASASGD